MGGYTCTYTDATNANSHTQRNYLLFQWANLWVIMMGDATNDSSDTFVYSLKRIIYVHNFQDGSFL